MKKIKAIQSILKGGAAVWIVGSTLLGLTEDKDANHFCSGHVGPLKAAMTYQLKYNMDEIRIDYGVPRPIAFAWGVLLTPKDFIANIDQAIRGCTAFDVIFQEPPSSPPPPPPASSPPLPPLPPLPSPQGRPYDLLPKGERYLGLQI